VGAVAGIVLAGGAGRRMGGVDKAALTVGGATLLDRVLAAARPLCDFLVVVGAERPVTVEGVRFVREAEPGGGPVPAVLAGVDACPECDVVLVVAVDLPLLEPPHLARLLSALDGADAAASSEAKGPNPLLAAYGVPALRRRAGGLGPGSPAGRLLPPAPALVDLGRAALNVNRPADLAEAEAALRQPGSSDVVPATRNDPGRGSGTTLGRPGRATSGGEGMNENYPDRYAEALGLQLHEIEEQIVLDLARIVAHGSERRFAPLSTFLAGQFVAELVRTGISREEALAEAMAIAERTLDPES
jgi:molybdopterin-guanine dinucleotide biosynthesis protein A